MFGSGNTRSLWMEIQLPEFPSLKKNISTDVCIIGGGISGLTCAYTLAKRGKSVVLLDKEQVACGETARTTGHLTWVLDDRFFELEKLFGTKGVQLAGESHSAAIDYIEKIINEEDIDCDFERGNGYLFVPPEDSKDILDKEFDAIQRAGLNVKKVDRAPFSKSFDTGTALEFTGQAKFHVMKYLEGLIKGILKYGGQIYGNSHVVEIKDGAPCITKTKSGHSVKSNFTIVATCTPINNRFEIHTKQAAYRTYVICAKVPKGSVPNGLYWDTPDPYHYIRTQKNIEEPENDWLLIGGADHKTGQCKTIEENYDELEKWARVRFPLMEKVEYKWSGQIYEPIDSLAFIGKNPSDKNIYIVTGDSGNGLTHGTLAGIILPDLILGLENKWKELYDPSRITLKATPEYIDENFNTALQYLDWLTPGELSKIEELPKNEGVIFREGIHKLAVYKDSKNKVHIRSALCPHLGACLRWNNGEKSWDCPAHGSRFDINGQVLCGPASDGLKECSFSEQKKKKSKKSA